MTSLEEAQAAIDRRRANLKALEQYRGRLTECYTLEALIEVLQARADEVNRVIADDINRDQKSLDECTAYTTKVRTDP